MSYYVHHRAMLSDISEIYYVHSRACDVRGKVSGALSGVRSIGFLDVKGCLKFFGAVFRGVFAWLKSMLSALGFLIVVSPDYGHYISVNVDGVECLD